MDYSGTHDAMRKAAEDEQARTARRAVCAVLLKGFGSLGDFLLVAGYTFGPQRADGTSPFANGDDRLMGLGYLSLTAASLVGASAGLLEDGNLYAASALNRQIVEVEYLAWAFAEDQDEAAAWLRSSKEERLRRWQPRHLRDRSQGRFRGVDYGDHCEIGGHPTPAGARALLRETGIKGELLLSETATHGTSTWDYLILAVTVFALSRELDPKHLVPHEVAKAVGAAEGVWRQSDRLSSTWEGLRPSVQ